MPAKEEWRDIPGFGGWYQISTEGRVRSFRKGHGEKDVRADAPKIMTPRLTRNIKHSSTSLISFILCYVGSMLGSAMKLPNSAPDKQFVEKAKKG